MIYQSKNPVIQCKEGLRFHLLNTHDSVGRDLFFDGVYESETIASIRSQLRSGDIFVDAGANIGAISLAIAKNRDVQVYSFEPARRVFETLVKNIEINNFNNVQAFSIALSERNGTQDFFESERVHGWSGLVGIEGFNKYEVPVMTLQTVVDENQIKRISVLKSDIQGWEYFLFKGAERLMDEDKLPFIIFEFEWWAEENAGLAPGTAQQFLMDKGYRIYTLDGNQITSPLKTGSLMLIAKK